MNLGICSFSFHRLMAAGRRDIFAYILDCKALGCTQLDPWSAHLLPHQDGNAALQAGRNPSQSHRLLSDADEEHVRRIADAGRDARLPFGTIAVDGVHIYEPTEEARRVNRQGAYRWLHLARILGAKQVRIDAGGPEEMPDEIFRIIVDGYRDLIDRARPLGIEVLIENHWGPSVVPDHLVRLLESVEGLGLLYDTANFKVGHKDEGRRRCAPYARATHIKTRRWNQHGAEDGEDVPTAVRYLLDAGYQGTWGIESVPVDGDEMTAVKRTIDLLHRLIVRAARPRITAPLHPGC